MYLIMLANVLHINRPIFRYRRWFSKKNKIKYLHLIKLLYTVAIRCVNLHVKNKMNKTIFKKHNFRHILDSLIEDIFAKL